MAMTPNDEKTMENLTYIPDRLKTLAQTISDLEWNNKDATIYKAEMARLDAMLKQGKLYSPNF